jgi:uncharacterized protein YbcI
MSREQKQQVALAEITRGLAQLHTEYYGQGPTKARSYRVNDTVVCFLEGGFTTVERTLIDDGKADAVHVIRRSFQSTMETPFRAVVERAIGLKVIAYMSQIHTNPDLAVEFFMLEPRADGEVAGDDDGLHAAQHEEELPAPA